MYKTGFYLFERKHGKEDTASSRIRGHWLIKKWKGAEEIKWGKKYDVLIYQKVYETNMAKEWQGKAIQILDLCDPDWFEYQPVREMIEYVDAVTVSSMGLKRYIENITDKPVKFIPDGVLELGERKKHKGKAKKIVWFGYAHNDNALRDAEQTIRELGLELTVISNANYEGKMVNANWISWQSDKQCDDEIKKHDIVILPHSQNPKYIYKSKNKTYKSWALGIPVAHTGDDLRRLLIGKERDKESKEKYNLVKDKYMTKHAVSKFKELIDELKT